MTDTDPASIINILFLELSGIFPAFKQAWPTQREYNAAKRNWVKAMIAAGINKTEMLRWGLMRCRESESNFVITPGQFIKWCYPRPQYIGFPATEDAYRIALVLNRGERVKRELSDSSKKLIMHVIGAIGSFKFRTMPEDKATSRFFRIYEDSCYRVYKGELDLNTYLLSNHDELDNKNVSLIVMDQFKEIRGREDAMRAIREMGIPIKNNNQKTQG